MRKRKKRGKGTASFMLQRRSVVRSSKKGQVNKLCFPSPPSPQGRSSLGVEYHPCSLPDPWSHSTSLFIISKHSVWLDLHRAGIWQTEECQVETVGRKLHRRASGEKAHLLCAADPVSDLLAPVCRACVCPGSSPACVPVAGVWRQIWPLWSMVLPFHWSGPSACEILKLLIHKGQELPELSVGRSSGN